MPLAFDAAVLVTSSNRNFLPQAFKNSMHCSKRICYYFCSMLNPWVLELFRTFLLLILLQFRWLQLAIKLLPCAGQIAKRIGHKLQYPPWSESILSNFSTYLLPLSYHFFVVVDKNGWSSPSRNYWPLRKSPWALDNTEKSGDGTDGSRTRKKVPSERTHWLKKMWLYTTCPASSFLEYWLHLESQPLSLRISSERRVGFRTWY